jgi:hypothetical protein
MASVSSSTRTPWMPVMLYRPSVCHHRRLHPSSLANVRLRKMALISWENVSLSSSPAVPGIARVVLATMSAPRRGLVEPLIECRLRDFQTIPLGRSVQSSPLLIAGFPGPSPCDLRASLVFLVSTHWYYTGTRFRGQLPRTPPPPLPVLLPGC